MDYWSRQHFLSPNGKKKILCLLLTMQPFRCRPTVSTLLAPGQKCFLRVPPTTARSNTFSEFFLRAALHLALDGFDDTAQQHRCVFDQPVWELVSFDCILQCGLCVAILSYTISERDCGWLCVTCYRNFCVPDELMNLATLSLVQGSSIPFFTTTLLTRFWCLSSFTAMDVTDSSGIV